MFPATTSAAASNATALSAAACSAATPILGIAASATIWGAYTTLSLQALKKSVELLQLAKTQGDLATEQAKGFQEFKDQLHATEMRWRTLHTSLSTLHSTVSETKGEIGQMSKNQETEETEEMRKINATMLDIVKAWNRTDTTKLVSTTPAPYPPTTPRHTPPPSPLHRWKR